MQKLITITTLLVTIISSAACSPESGSESDIGSDSVSLSGFWRLNGTSESYDIVVDDNNRFMAFNGNGLLIGNSTDSIYQSGNTVRASGYGCSISDAQCVTLSFELDVDSSTELSGTVTDGAETVNVTARKLTSMDSEVSLSDVANKTWVSTTNATATMVIYPDGSIQGTMDDGSSYTGSTTDTGKNAFTFTVQASIDGTTYTIPGLTYIDSSDRLVSGGALRAGNQFYWVYGVSTAQ